MQPNYQILAQNARITTLQAKEILDIQELKVFVQEISNSSSKEETKRPAIKTNDTTKESLYLALVCVTNIGIVVIKKKKHF